MGLSRAEFFSSSHAFAGTFMYAAPEMLLGRPSNEKVQYAGQGGLPSSDTRPRPRPSRAQALTVALPLALTLTH